MARTMRDLQGLSGGSFLVGMKRSSSMACRLAAALLGARPGTLRHSRHHGVRPRSPGHLPARRGGSAAAPRGSAARCCTARRPGEPGACMRRLLATITRYMCSKMTLAWLQRAVAAHVVAPIRQPVPESPSTGESPFNGVSMQERAPIAMAQHRKRPWPPLTRPSRLASTAWAPRSSTCRLRSHARADHQGDCARPGGGLSGQLRVSHHSPALPRSLCACAAASSSLVRTNWAKTAPPLHAVCSCR